MSHAGNENKAYEPPLSDGGRSPSIYRKLTLSLVLSMALVSFLGLVMAYYGLARKAEKELNQLADEHLSFLVGALKMPLWNFDQDSVAVITQSFAQNEVVERIRIMDAQGRAQVIFNHGYGDETPVQRFGVVVYDGVEIGSVELALTKNLYRESLQKMVFWAGLGVFCLLLVLILVTRLLVRWFLRQPLKSLSEIASAYAAGEYETVGGRMPYEEFQAFERVLGLMGQEIKHQVMQICDAQKRYRDIFESAMEGIFQTAQERMLSINPALARMLGYSSPEEILEAPAVSAQTFFADSGRWEELLERLCCEGHVSDFEARLFRRDKGSIWGSFDVRGIFDDAGQLIASEGFVRDITRRRQVEEEKAQLEAQLRHSQKMEAIGTLSGGVAHEFNNMLGIILGNVELAIDDIPEDHPAYDFLSEIRNASLRGTEIVQQLLRFSRQKDQPLKHLDVGPLVKESLGFMRVSIPTVIDFDVRLPEQCWPIVGDPTQIHQVLINLCTNSAHAMEGEGGTLTVEVKNICSETSEVFFDQELPPGKYVCIKVSDTGCGIEPDHIDRIFEPFFSTKDVGQGTGMGMAVVHGIMKGHGGGVRVVSCKGEWTTVECCFPMSSAEPSEDFEVTCSAEEGSGNILCVDDEESICRVMQRQLERLGYDVEICIHATEALALVEEDPQRFHVVITDLLMPKLRGDKLLMRLKAMNPGIKTILCSGFSEDMDAEKAAQLHADVFLRKPVSRVELARTLGRLVNGEEAGSN